MTEAEVAAATGALMRARDEWMAYYSDKEHGFQDRVARFLVKLADQIEAEAADDFMPDDHSELY